MSVPSVFWVRGGLLLTLAAWVSVFLGCQPQPAPTVPEGTCATCRGTGTVTTTEMKMVGMTPQQPGVPATPIYQSETKVSVCSVCGGSGKTK